ncbi:hypothetical protein [Embleya sp. NBC_00896]|uniref:hypothetical protein n=1 Tax=Embleya sp. NBC_00896 TaxID=2975961 RepID=UPI002F91454D|nr:glycoside hydrolase family 31 protein [Embleya sp. NBC_00896]
MPTRSEITDQFPLGDDIMVVPVVTKEAVTREAVIPPGTWQADDGAGYSGPAIVTVDAPLSRLPCFRRR